MKKIFEFLTSIALLFTGCLGAGACEGCAGRDAAGTVVNVTPTQTQTVDQSTNGETRCESTCELTVVDNQIGFDTVKVCDGVQVSSEFLVSAPPGCQFVGQGEEPVV